MADAQLQFEANEYSEILEGLWLGPMPSKLDFVKSLHDNAGVKAIVSLQTNIDLLTLGFEWPQMETLLRRGGITNAVRVPILDFDEHSLVHLLDEAIDAVHQLRDVQGLSTYVHCTAGVNRAPTVMIGYLIAHHGLDLDEA